jgi:hypothetical protein
VNYRSMIAALAASTTLAGCGVAGNMSTSSGSSLRSIGPPTSSAHKGASTGSLYITSESPAVHGGIVVYGGQPLKYLRSITNGVGGPNAIAFNSLRQLFVTNPQLATITVYTAKGINPIRTLSNRFMKDPFQMAISSKDDVYQTTRRYTLIYIKGLQTQVEKINRSGSGLAIDSSDNVYLGQTGVITVYAPRAIKASRTITDGVGEVSRLAIDASGNLYDSNFQLGSCGNVTVYNAATGALENTITDGVCTPVGLAFDSSGNLYVGNWGNGKTSKPSVTVYAAGTGALMETITQGINDPIALAIDPSNNLYVANQADNSSSVTVYPPNQTSPSQTLTKGIDFPFDLKWL